MNMKMALVSGALATTFLLGACGNDNMDKAKEDNKAETSMKDNKKDESKASDNAKVMKKGTFKGENKEMVKGNAEIKDGKLMLTDYKSSKGPDLHVYLTKGNDIKKGVKLDEVKYDEATQTFDLKDVNLEDYDTVTIYCDKAHVIFGSAALK
ncbi:DM13 domain-containing protein [Staphylococcus ursi]|uniref:DM13 domain-containing protein n=1 Tax=Staphylococcus sp. MI 10-1553 TaxID=1912064 RepID=UPI00139892BE|nr:DM13 domain-containing protein [Staphylococcus sp. MI 10-1553]QHW36156.1 DM13 domain-containing protein [Staphylococcus sp. MI 10-1553]